MLHTISPMCSSQNKQHSIPSLRPEWKLSNSYNPVPRRVPATLKVLEYNGIAHSRVFIIYKGKQMVQLKNGYFEVPLLETSEFCMLSQRYLRQNMLQMDRDFFLIPGVYMFIQAHCILTNLYFSLRTLPIPLLLYEEWAIDLLILLVQQMITLHNYLCACNNFVLSSV